MWYLAAMANKPNVENRWWVETSLKKPREQQQKSEMEMPQLPIAMTFYTVARDYDQDRAKDDLTDNNLRIARAGQSSTGRLGLRPVHRGALPAAISSSA